MASDEAWAREYWGHGFRMLAFGLDHLLFQAALRSGLDDPARVARREGRKLTQLAGDRAWAATPQTCYTRHMVALRKRAPARMTLDEFLAWDSGDRSGRTWQLIDGEPVAMAPGSDAHGAIQSELGASAGQSPARSA